MLLSALVAFVAIEATGIVTNGTEGTLSAYLQCLGGIKPRCRHVHLARLVLITFFGWVVAHLGWDVLGCDTHLHRRSVCSAG